MPILQHKLVIKSIEALHDEALSLARDTASNHGNNAPPAVLHAAAPLQEPPAVAPTDTSANVRSETSGDDDIMVRIDHLLEKLDDDVDVAIAPLADEEPKSSTGDGTGNAISTPTANNVALDNLANPESPILSNEVDHADENAILDVAENSSAKPSGKTGDVVSNDISVDDQSGKTVPPDQAKALADIAAAIYQAGQEAVDTVVTDSNQNNTVPFDMGVLSATIADEVRQTVSSVMIAELPKMVHNAVREAVRALPTASFSQSKSVTNKQVTTKNATPRTTTVKKKAAKKVAAKKTPAKKVSKKRTK